MDGKGCVIMKPFLGIDLTTDKKNTKINGTEFLVQLTSDTLAQSHNNSFEQVETRLNEAKLPLPLRILETTSMTVGVIIVTSLLKAFGKDDGVTISQAYANASWLFWLGGICLIIWVILTILSKKKSKSVLESEESLQTFSRLDGVSNAIFNELSVPSESKEVDVFSFSYKTKNDGIKVCENGMQAAPYFNLIFKAFADSENLYIANLEGKYAFPLSALSSIKTIKKHIRMVSWNKDERFNKGVYKQYKLTEDNQGSVHCKSYGILEINHNGELWGIYVPCYEIPIFEELTGLKADK